MLPSSLASDSLLRAAHGQLSVRASDSTRRRRNELQRSRGRLAGMLVYVLLDSVWSTWSLRVRHVRQHKPDRRCHGNSCGAHVVRSDGLAAGVLGSVGRGAWRVRVGPSGGRCGGGVCRVGWPRPRIRRRRGSCTCPRAPVATQPPPAPVAGAVLTPYRDDPADSDHGAFDGTDGVELTIHTSGNTLRERSGRSAASGAAGGRGAAASDVIDGPTAAETRKAWLLFFALTVQHIPEALAMGVAFADADGSGRWGASFSVTLAIGLQDIPEGLAAALVP